MVRVKHKLGSVFSSTCQDSYLNEARGAATRRSAQAGAAPGARACRGGETAVTAPLGPLPRVQHLPLSFK